MIVSFSISVFDEWHFKINQKKGRYQKETCYLPVLKNLYPFLDERKCSDSGWSDQRVSNPDDWPLYQCEKTEIKKYFIETPLLYPFYTRTQIAIVFLKEKNSTGGFIKHSRRRTLLLLMSATKAGNVYKKYILELYNLVF